MLQKTVIKKYFEKYKKVNLVFLIYLGKAEKLDLIVFSTVGSGMKINSLEACVCKLIN